jgi:hypothetical protein
MVETRLLFGVEWAHLSVIVKNETRRQRRERELREAKVATQVAKASTVENKERFNEVLALFGFACSMASWGWSVIAPSSSIKFGSALLFIAAIAILIAVRRMWSLGKLASVGVAIVLLLGFSAFDWYIVITPQQGKPFHALLVHGYHLTGECGNLPGKQEMPTWMRDESKAWQAQAEQLISEKLNVKDSQLWQGAIIYGLVKDEKTAAYQCTWLANKVAALETIISTEYESELKHQDYNGPTYWFNAANGKVDISEAFKGGKTRANIVINGDDGENKQRPKQSVPP